MGDTLELLRRRGAANAQNQVEVPGSKASAKQKVEDPSKKVEVSSRKKVENSRPAQEGEEIKIKKQETVKIQISSQEEENKIQDPAQAGCSDEVPKRGHIDEIPEEEIKNTIQKERWQGQVEIPEEMHEITHQEEIKNTSTAQEKENEIQDPSPSRESSVKALQAG